MKDVFQGKLEEINEKEKNELLVKINSPNLFTFYYRYSAIERMIKNFFAYFLFGGSIVYFVFDALMPKFIKNLAKNNYTDSVIDIGIFSVLIAIIIFIVYELTTDFISIISRKYNFFAIDKEYIYSFEGKNKITIIPLEKAGRLSNFDDTIKYKSNLSSAGSIYIGETTEENLKKLRKFYNSNIYKKESTENINSFQ